MTRALRIAIAATALAGLPLAAEEKPQPKQPPTQATAVTPAAVPDSPLVAAARRSNRLGKKPANVITNETLNKTGANAHFSTSDRPMPPLVIYRPEVGAKTAKEDAAARKATEQQAAAEAARKAKQREEARQRRMAVASEADEDGLYDDETPSEAEAGNARKLEPQKPPQS